MWCSDPRHGVIIADFAVQGTLARQILESPLEVTNKDGLKVSNEIGLDMLNFFVLARDCISLRRLLVQFKCCISSTEIYGGLLVL